MKFIMFLRFIISSSSWLVSCAIYRFHCLGRIFSLRFSFRISIVSEDES
jgi:hypothetical protein